MVQVLQFGASIRYYGPSLDISWPGRKVLGCEYLLYSIFYGACEMQVYVGG